MNSGSAQKSLISDIMKGFNLVNKTMMEIKTLRRQEH